MGDHRAGLNPGEQYRLAGDLNGRGIEDGVDRHWPILGG
jgi:hypothetical protein